jgi:hypothetical protein
MFESYFEKREEMENTKQNRGFPLACLSLEKREFYHLGINGL